jgi:hypothetical protein
MAKRSLVRPVAPWSSQIQHERASREGANQKIDDHQCRPNAAVMNSRPPQPFSWLRTRRLAIGAFPQNSGHWEALECLGIRGVFSCCDPNEGAWLPPDHWRSDQIALPDHRHNTPPSPELLSEALDRLAHLYADSEMIYLHCWAGQERSALMAVGLLCRSEGLSFFDALTQVRSLHTAARPITAHLVILEELLMDQRRSQD